MRLLNKFCGCVVFISIISLVFSSTASGTNQWKAKLRPGFMAGEGDNASDFYLDIFLPVWGNEKALVYFNPNVRFDDRRGNEQNFGLGYRRLMMNDEMILGVNFFYDQMRSRNNHDYRQIGTGLEMMTRWIDSRINYYHPISNRQHYLGNKNEFSFGSSALLLHKGWEEQTKGFDFEVGTLIPFISDYVETRAYAGGYMFNSGIRDDISGMKIRVEARPVRILNVNIEMKDDDINGIDTFIGAYLEIPFSVENIYKGKNPFEGLKDAFAVGKGTRDLKERMVEKVVRDRNIPVYELTGKHSSSEKIAEVIYVNKDNNEHGDGTLSNPYHNIMSVRDDVRFLDGAWVYVFSWDSTPDTYDTVNLQLKPNMVLWGQGYRHPSLGLGGDGGNPVLAGTAISITNDNPDEIAISTCAGIVCLADMNEVMGLTFSHGDRGIVGAHIGGANIHHNSFRELNTGVFIRNYMQAFSDKAFSYQYSDNEFSQVGAGIVTWTSLVGLQEVRNLQLNNIYDSNIFTDVSAAIVNLTDISSFVSGGSVLGSSISNTFTNNRITNSTSSSGVYGIINNNLISTLYSSSPIINTAIANVFERNYVNFERLLSGDAPAAITNHNTVDTWGEYSDIVGTTVRTEYAENQIMTGSAEQNIMNRVVASFNSGLYTRNADVLDSRMEYIYSSNRSDCGTCVWNIFHQDEFGSQYGATSPNSGLYYTFRGNDIRSTTHEFNSLQVSALTYNAPVTLLMERNKVTSGLFPAVGVLHWDIGEGVLTADFGGGILGSSGQNSFHRGVIIDANSGTNLSAEANWWNNSAVNPYPGETNIPVASWLYIDPLQ